MILKSEIFALESDWCEFLLSYKDVCSEKVTSILVRKSLPTKNKAKQSCCAIDMGKHTLCFQEMFHVVQRVQERVAVKKDNINSINIFHKNLIASLCGT